ncbi:MAG: hypothetical protein WC308_03565, partial [archaeon]
MLRRNKLRTLMTRLRASIFRKSISEKAGRAKKPIFVHLGNLEDFNSLNPEATKTIRYAKKFPGAKFVGIDLHKYVNPSLVELE